MREHSILNMISFPFTFQHKQSGFLQSGPVCRVGKSLLLGPCHRIRWIRWILAFNIQEFFVQMYKRRSNSIENNMSVVPWRRVPRRAAVCAAYRPSSSRSDSGTFAWQRKTKRFFWCAAYLPFTQSLTMSSVFFYNLFYLASKKNWGNILHFHDAVSLN